MESMGTTPVFEIQFETMTYGGLSLGHLPDGRAIFVPFVLPGEVACVCMTSEKQHHAQGEVINLQKTVSERIQPRCRHFGVCGGCHYQHLGYTDQLSWKTSILGEQMQRIGKVVDLPIQSTVPSPNPWNYRNFVQFHLDPQGKLGYIKQHAQEVLAINECHLPGKALDHIWPQLHFETIPGLERIGLRLGLEDELLLIMESQVPEPPQVLVEDLDISVVHLSPSGTLILVGSDHVYCTVLERAFRISTGSFFQVNSAVAGLMVEYLLSHLAIDHRSTVMDIYSGVGLFSAFLAPKAKRVIAVESSPSACNDFVVNLDEFDNVELYEASAEQVLTSLDVHPDIILVDPPRSGLHYRVIDGILRLHPHQLAYISCDPATLGRDAKKLLEGGYTLKQITPFDMFPQTYHIESISLWEAS
jgi:23S rRNA (uracil1939-C5)-methyltransferase